MITCVVAVIDAAPVLAVLHAHAHLCAYGPVGATASVLLSYILPSVTFIRLLDATPELLGGGKFMVIPDQVRWVKRAGQSWDQPLNMQCSVRALALHDRCRPSLPPAAVALHIASYT